ncbi:MAG: amidohydrolase family protein [Planctomycetota bacterium]|nr:amidohydrolase family protein [Planctomycetota bacterium]
MATQFFDGYTRIGPRPSTHGSHPWSLEHLIEEMHHCSISGALVAATAQTLYDANFENRRLSQRLAKYDYLFPIWNVHPHWLDDFPAPSDLGKMLADANVRAVSVHPSTNGWAMNSRYSQPLWDEMERTQTLVILDLRTMDGKELEPLLLACPRVPFLLHGMTWSQGRFGVPLLRHHKNLHLGFDFFQVNYALEWLTGLGLEDQLVFCSNATEMSMGAHRFYVDYADVSLAVRAKIAGGNLTRLLKGLKPPREIVNKSEDPIMAEAREGRPLSPLVIDMHAHMLDEGLNGAGASYSMYRGGPRGTYELAKRMGIDAMGIMSWNGTVGVHADEGNQCVIDALNAYPDFYWGLATFDVMHESAEQMRAKMERIYADKRFLGLKPYPQYGIPYHDRRYECWWEFGNERHLYCGLHPVHWFQATEFEAICPKYPNLTVVAYHGGSSYEIADTCINLAKKHANFMIEITLTPVCGGIIDYLVKGAGADRVMYGSDLPMRDPRQQLGWVVYSRLGLEDKKKVLGLNAKRVIDNVRAHQR